MLKTLESEVESAVNALQKRDYASAFKSFTQARNTYNKILEFRVQECGKPSINREYARRVIGPIWTWNSAVPAALLNAVAGGKQKQEKKGEQKWPVEMRSNGSSAQERLLEDKIDNALDLRRRSKRQSASQQSYAADYKQAVAELGVPEQEILDPFACPEWLYEPPGTQQQVSWCREGVQAARRFGWRVNYALSALQAGKLDAAFQYYLAALDAQQDLTLAYARTREFACMKGILGTAGDKQFASAVENELRRHSKNLETLEAAFMKKLASLSTASSLSSSSTLFFCI